MTSHLRRAGAVTAVAIALAAAGCGSSKPAYCADRDALQTSLGDLKSVNVQKEGVSGVEAKLRKVESDAQALVASAKKEFQPQAAALQTSVAQLKSAVSQAAASPSAQSIGHAATSASAVASAFGELSNAVKSKC